VTLESVRSEFARIYGLSEAKGAIISDVVQQERNGLPTPAEKAGLQPNDVIIEFNGQTVQNAQDLIARVAGAAVGQTVAITYLRDTDGKLERRTANVTLGERPDFYARDGEIVEPKVKTDSARTAALVWV